MSFQGLLRRLFPKRMLAERRQPELIDWSNVEYLASEAGVKLNVSHERIAMLHPTDVAKLIEGLSYKQEAEIMRSLMPSCISRSAR